MSTMPIQAEIRATWGKSVRLTVSHKNDRYTGSHERFILQESINTGLLCQRAKEDNSLESTSFEILPKKDRQLEKYTI